MHELAERVRGVEGGCVERGAARWGEWGVCEKRRVHRLTSVPSSPCHHRPQRPTTASTHHRPSNTLGYS